ncbi:MAG: HDOD domain-containing protein [Candidatus Acidiferrales bacterium]
MQRFIALQPILDAKQNLSGYELLFRSKAEGGFVAPADGDASATLIIESSFLFDLHSLCGGYPAFINLSQNSLLLEHALLLPSERIVVEVLETVKPVPEVVAACRKLKQAGYRLALDDFEDSPAWEPLLKLANIVKIDFLSTSAAQKKSLAKRFGARGISMLAEKVERIEDFNEAKRLGYRLFQGYFFARPQIISTRDVTATKRQNLRIIAVLGRPEMNFAEVERMLKTEPSLCYKFLRYLNSPLLGFRSEIRSIRHAVALIGENDFRRWLSAMAIVALGEDKPEELTLISISRGLFCESLASQAGLAGRGTDLFFLGLLSVMDVLFGRPMAAVLDEIHVAPDVRDALTGKDNRFKQVLDCVTSYERGDWPACSAVITKLRLSESSLPGLYLRSLDWARQAFSA